MGLDDDEAVSVSSSRRTDTLSIHDGVDGDFDEFEGEKYVSASVGSTESLDHVHEDFNQSAATRATGYVGKSSELTWLHRLNRQVADGSDIDEGEPDSAYMDGHSTTPAHDQLGSSPTPLHKLTYHCDDIPMFNLDHVDPYEMPHQQTANLLFQSYLEIVHPAFPILGKITFQEQFHMFSDNLSMNTGDKWRAILNLIFAISAKYAQLVQAGWRGDERDHMIYFTRARKLGFTSESLLNHPDLQRLQIAGLMAFYLTSVNQISR